tara:strand:- start:909 stop:1778 length:870 start_codon:yes stop_codon:yes gene_type:complete
MLNDLFQSIVTQIQFDVELVIVNDGSFDETMTTINNWINNQRIKIKYYYQEHSGRGLALRKALLNADGEYSIIMDDDDYFTDGAFGLINESIQKLRSMSNLKRQLVGICFLCLDEDRKILGDQFKDKEYITDFCAMRLIERVLGDKKEIVKTEIIKKNIFDHHENEKRVVTSTIWHKIAYNYDCLCLNMPIAVKRYVSGGMSDRLLVLKAESPNYQIDNCIIKINYPNQFKLKIIILFSAYLWKYWFYGGTFSLFRVMKSRQIITVLSLPIGIILYIRDQLIITCMTNK